MRRLVLVIAVLAAGCGKSHERRAAPDDARATAATPADAEAGHERAEISRAYSRALHRGRKLADKGDYDGAIAAFREALAATPADARALSELGWAAFQKGDLALADDATEKSIAAATDAKLRAASLYNRGRIAEARKDSKHAIAAYEASLELRQSAVVAGRLAALEGRPRVVLAPRPVSGPFPDLDAACATLQFYEAGGTCDAPRIDGPRRLEHPPAPLGEVRIISDAPSTEGGESWASCRLALRTDAGWFLSALADCEQSKWQHTEIRALEAGPPDADGRPTVVWRHRVKSGDRGWDRDGRRYAVWVTTDSTMICGVGASGTPACTPWIPVSVQVSGNYRYSDEVPYALSVQPRPRRRGNRREEELEGPARRRGPHRRAPARVSLTPASHRPGPGAKATEV